MERKERLYLEVNHAVSELTLGSRGSFFANFANCPFGLRGPVVKVVKVLQMVHAIQMVHVVEGVQVVQVVQVV